MSETVRVEKLDEVFPLLNEDENDV